MRCISKASVSAFETSSRRVKVVSRCGRKAWRVARRMPGLGELRWFQDAAGKLGESPVECREYARDSQLDAGRTKWE
ncbi:hypothetical protein QE152_g8000 [Popillia japonica]|uniref:Uncharacterized protein n=1 Tax=Popillia japonica TaxID=7064 RepID=A0AAW1M5X1_POPJA